MMIWSWHTHADERIRPIALPFPRTVLVATQDSASYCGVYLGHQVILHGHGDDVDADHSRDGQVEVLAAGDCVESKSQSRVVGPVRHRSALCRAQTQATDTENSRLNLQQSLYEVYNRPTVGIRKYDQHRKVLIHVSESRNFQLSSGRLMQKFLRHYSEPLNF